MTTVKKSTSKYTAEMVALITAAQPLDIEVCEQLSKDKLFASAGITGRGIASKARSLQLQYVKQERVSKSGEPIATKIDLVKEIEKAIGATGLDSLAKAEKKALQALLRAVDYEASVAA
jgi:hypothetical protein